MPRLIALAVALTVSSAAPSAAATYEILLRQTASEQTRVLAGLIRSARHRCPRVTRRLFMGADRFQAGYWTARCSTGASYMVQVKNDAGGTSRILSCAVARAVGVSCWRQFR